jgi:hypothetical protein
MERTTPIVRGKLLHYRQLGQEGTLIVEPVEWYCWLDPVSLFAFKSPQNATWQQARWLVLESLLPAQRSLRLPGQKDAR